MLHSHSSKKALFFLLFFFVWIHSAWATAPTTYNPGAVLTVPNASSYVTVADKSNLRVGQRTVMMWLKAAGSSPQWQPLVMKTNSSGNDMTRNFSLWIEENSLKIHYSATFSGVNGNFTTFSPITANQ